MNWSRRLLNQCRPGARIDRLSLQGTQDRSLGDIVKHRFLNSCILLLTLSSGLSAALAQDSNPPQQPGDGAVQGPGRGQRGGREGWGTGMMGRGVIGTVTEVAPDHYTIKTESGDLYTV